MKKIINIVGISVVVGMLMIPRYAAAQERTNVWSTPSLDTNKLVEVQMTNEFYYGVSAGAGGMVSGSVSGWYDSGTIVSNYAAPTNQHYVFDRWQNAPAGKETENPLVFGLDAVYTNVIATFKLRTYTVEVISQYLPWFGTNTIGNPQGAGAYPAGTNVTVSVDKYIYNPTNQYMRLRVTGARVVDK